MRDFLKGAAVVALLTLGAHAAFAQNATSSGPAAAPTASALPLAGADVNTSIAITTANTFQQGVATNLGRKAGSLYNSSATDTCRVFFGALASATVANSRPLPAGSTMTMASQAPVNVSCPATTDTIIADEQQ